MTGSHDLSWTDLKAPLALPGMRIALQGGSFNPPHDAHRLISLEAMRRFRLHQVWWLVTPGNPLKNHSGLAPLADRVKACRALAAHPRIKVTAVEAALHTTYTATTLRILTSRFPGVDFIWLMGADNLASFHRWNEWETIFETMPIAVVNRPTWTYHALSSPTARRFEHFRLPASRAPLLPSLATPAWCFLPSPMSPLSSTELRANGKGWHWNGTMHATGIRKPPDIAKIPAAHPLRAHSGLKLQAT